MQTSRPPSWPITSIGRLHQALVFQRRTRVLSEMLASQIPQGASVLDIGCGDGTIGNLIARLRPDVTVRGVEFMVRPECKIECCSFDGLTLPFADASFDVCLFVDVLHHTQDPSMLLRETVRVSRAWVLLKDHLDENLFDNVTLRIMDWVGNRPHGVVLTYNYQSRTKCRLTIAHWEAKLPLYPPLLSLLAGRGLHFISLLKITK
jgi:SAM-dependent methyltransferase